MKKSKTRYRELEFKTAHHDSDCNCADHQEMLTLGRELRRISDRKFEERKEKLNMASKFQCVGCKERAPNGESKYCPTCKKTTHWFNAEEYECRKCGMDLTELDHELCVKCSLPELYPAY